MSDVRNIDHLFIVKDDILYYCDENNVFYQYDLKMNKKSTLIDKRYEYYGPFNTGYYNKKNNYIFGNDDLYSNYYDILYIPSGLAKRENLNSNNNFKYNIQYYIPFENYVFGIYSKSFSNASTSNNYSYEILYSIDLKNDNKIINSKDKTNTYENVLYVK